MPDPFDLAWQAHQAGELAKAEEGYRRILQREPRNGRVWFVLGNLCQDQARNAEALACFKQAAELEPREPEGHFHVGNALLKQEKWTEAEAAYRECLALRPDHLEALVNLGFALGEQERPQEAEACYRQALQLKDDVPEIQQNLANVLRDRGELDEAVGLYQRALALRPDYAKAHVNLGVALIGLRRIGEAVEHLQRGVELETDFAEAFNSLGAAVSVLRRFDEAHAHYEHAIRLKPDYADAHWNRSLLWLLQGNFERGWPAFEWRWRCRRTTPRPSLSQPEWDGSPLDGRTILLYSEQGLGDMLQFVRYARIVKNFGGRVVVQCQRPLLRILASCAGIDELAAQGEPAPKHDVQAALMSLPLILGTRTDNIPADIPYLAADSELVEHWRRQLAPLRGFRVGIAWKGSTRYPWDRHRSTTPEHFEPLARVPGVQLVSLQKAEAGQVGSPTFKVQTRGDATDGSDRRPAAGGEFEVVSFGNLVDEASGPFMDTAAMIANLDLVVSVDTSIGHLAGALGRPTWLALNYSADWRWMVDRNDTPWYPTTRLFRQQQPGDWPGVFRQMAAELERLVAKSPTRPILIEVTPDELGERINRIESELPTADPERVHVLRAELARLRTRKPLP
ncbi:MAG TPA: tetratricopeptide repeat-containing glycosyltransferase family protein [Pirellulales bacterium]|nr:tetratricopeptide repeat-containing glycosyltransferase family protein [Pirellulales bacterium]